MSPVPSLPHASGPGAALCPLLATAGASDPWQWLFFAALGAWLVGGAVRPDAVPAGPPRPTPDCGVPPATDAGRWYLAAVGGVLLICTLAACWGAIAGG